jgi:hypothetical protein
MKTSNKYSGNKIQRPEIEKSLTRTLEEVMADIQTIMDKYDWVEARLEALRAKGYQIEECWVKNGSVGDVCYMRRKKVYRIQVTTYESHGDYNKAFCVVIPFNDLSVKISELTKMMNFSIIRKPRKESIRSGLQK